MFLVARRVRKRKWKKKLQNEKIIETDIDIWYIKSSY